MDLAKQRVLIVLALEEDKSGQYSESCSFYIMEEGMGAAWQSARMKNAQWYLETTVTLLQSYL